MELNFQTFRLPVDCEQNEPRPGQLIFPGSFNPVHHGHLEMARIARKEFSTICWFEISSINAEKGLIDSDTQSVRLEQNFAGNGVIVSNAATFVQKSILFPGAIFIVGADTILRVAELKYYQGKQEQLDSSLATITENGCQFCVFGRKISNNFVDSRNIKLAENLLAICKFVDQESFAKDISSTSIREMSGEE